MALIRNLVTEYIGRFFNPTVNSPQGNFKNRTSDTALDGTYIDEQWANDADALRQSLFIASQTVLDGNGDEGGNSQAYKALIEQCQGAASNVIESAGSAVNAYLLEESPNNQPPGRVFIGMILVFTPAVTSTSSVVTVNAFGFGGASVVNVDGQNIGLGQISNALLNVIEWNGTNWVLIDKLEFDFRHAGFGFNGLAKNIGTTIDSILVNSRSAYSAIIPGVTTVITSGILTVKMNINNGAGGKQVFEITEDLSAQKGETWERYLTAAGVWQATWQRVGPARGDFVNAVSGLPILEGSTSISLTTLNDNVWQSYGPTGSGADVIVSGLDGIPTNVDWLELKIVNEMFNVLTTVTSDQLYQKSLHVRKNGTVVGTGNSNLISRLKFYLSAGDVRLSADDIITIKVPVSSLLFDLNVVYFHQAESLSYPTRIYLMGYGYNS